MRLHALAFLALLGSAAAAQQPLPEIYTPLHVGDRWEYGYFAPDGSLLSYRVARVVRERTVAGTAYVHVTQQDASPVSEPQGPLRQCLYNRESGPLSAEAAGLPDYECSLFPITSFTYGNPTVTQDTSVLIAGQAYPVSSTLSYGACGSGSGGSSSCTSRQFAAEVGLVGESATSCPGRGQPCSTRAYRLLHANVDGVEYGARVVDSEARPSPTQTLTLTAVPNPTAGAVTVTVSGAGGAVSVEAFDALGRRVAEATVVSGDHRFEFRPTAPGVYIVRATDDAGRAATARVVRR